MDHSVFAYIERLPTEKLKAFLQQYYAGEFTEDFSCVIAYMEDMLKRREKENEK